MGDSDIRQLQAKIDQLTRRMLLEWWPCPRSCSSFTEEESDKHPHAYGYCSDGLLKNGYSDPPTCETCGGAGEILVPLLSLKRKKKEA